MGKWQAYCTSRGGERQIEARGRSKSKHSEATCTCHSVLSFDRLRISNIDLHPGPRDTSHASSFDVSLTPHLLVAVATPPHLSSLTVTSSLCGIETCVRLADDAKQMQPATFHVRRRTAGQHRDGDSESETRVGELERRHKVKRSRQAKPSPGRATFGQAV